MSMINTPSDMAFLPEEDVATIPVEQQRAALEAGTISAAQPGLAPEAFVQPSRGGGGGGGGGGGRTVVSTEQFDRNGRRILRTTYSDGTFTDEDLGEVGGDGDATTVTAGKEFDEDAFARLNALLGRIGLQNLTGRIRELVAKGITDGDAILFELRGTDEFKSRFKANAARAAKGLPELDPATYVGLEQSFRDVLRSNNLPTGFYDENDDFAKLIEGDVSVAELQDRINQGYRKVQDADPEVRRQMQQLYGVSEQALAAYFIDPERGVVSLKRQAEAAQIAARGREQAGIQLTAQTAEELAARGITPEEAQARFAQRAQLAGLYETLAGEEALTAEEQLGATFGYDVAAQQRLARRAETRVAQFTGGGQFARTSGATSGTVETGLGGPQ